MIKKLITKKDLINIVSNAKSNMVSINLPKHISSVKVEPNEVFAIAFIESVLMHLNGRNLLTAHIEIDYTYIEPDYDPENFGESEPVKK